MSDCRGVAEGVGLAAFEPNRFVESQRRLPPWPGREVEGAHALGIGHRCHHLQKLSGYALAAHGLVDDNIFDVAAQPGGKGNAYKRCHADDAPVHSGDEQRGCLMIEDRSNAV